MHKLKNLKHIFAIATIVIVTVFCSILLLFRFFNDVNGFFIYQTGDKEYYWQDYIYKHSLSPQYFENDDKRNPSRTKVVIVNIDDDSVNYFQAKNIPFGKNIYADLTKRLVDHGGAKVVGYDIIFAIPDTLPSKTTSGLTNEEEFASLITQHDNVVIATDYQDTFCSDTVDLFMKWYKDIDTTSPETNPGASCLRRLGGIIITNANNGKLPPSIKDKYRSFLKAYHIKGKNIENLTDADFRILFCQKDDDGNGKYESCLNVPRSVYSEANWGMINIDGKYTRPLYGELSGDLPYASWKTHSGILSEEKYVYTFPLEMFKVAGGDITKFDLDKAVLNPYFGPERAFSNISLKDVLVMSPFELRSTFSGSYVLVGNTQLANNDFQDTPVTGNTMAKVELHAHFLEGLLQNKMLKRMPEAVGIIVFSILAIVFVIFYFLLPKYLSPIIAILSVIAIIWTSRYLYDKERVLVDIFPFFLAGVLPYIVTYIYKFFIVDREKRELQTNFGHYIDPLVVKEIADRDEPIELGGEKRELSILFSDIAGFTTISEKLAGQPQDLFYLMTSYLSNMTDILIGQGGTLDKYIGDAVMGFFGAPLPHPDHAARACRTALLMREQLPAFNKDISSHGMDPVDFRVGIATGEVMVGNIGSHDRFNYTVLGDTVNLASRLEGTGKEYSVHIIISDSAREKISDEFFVRELDTIAVKGKTEGVRIYELIGFNAKVIDKSIFVNYEKALTLYREGKYREAGEVWASQMEIDPPSRVMLDRCLAIVRGEVTVENGIFHMTHK